MNWFLVAYFGTRSTKSIKMKTVTKIRVKTIIYLVHSTILEIFGIYPTSVVLKMDLKGIEKADKPP